MLTQFPFNRKGDKQSFPIRNRIVAGMTLGQADDSPTLPLANLTETEQKILDVLDATEQLIDTLIDKRPASRCRASLWRCWDWK